MLRIASTATICNLVLEYSPSKKDVLSGGMLNKLVSLCHSENETNTFVRINAIWAIKNIVYQSSFEIKRQVLTMLGKELLYSLLQESDLSVQMQVLNLLRNAICGSVEEIDFVLELLDRTRFFQEIIRIMQKNQDLLTEQCIFILVNMLTGDERHRSFLMQSENCSLLILIRDLLKHSLIDIREGALWAIYNLACGDEILVGKRIHEMKLLEFDQQITALMLHENEPTVMDIAKKVVLKFQF